MKAMVLAAGLGTRLRPLTDDRPKALVEVNGRTLLEITLARLRGFGINQVIVNVHHFADLMVECPITKKRFRADQVELQTGVAYFYSGAVDGEAVRTLSEQSLREGIPYKIAEEVPDEFIR